MAEYIDREALLRKFKRLILGAKSLIDREVVDEVCDVIETFSAADVAEVKHGEWINGKWEDGDYKEQCSRCYEWSGEYYRGFCSSCGAIMDGKEKDHE